MKTKNIAIIAAVAVLIILALAWKFNLFTQVPTPPNQAVPVNSTSSQNPPANNTVNVNGHAGIVSTSTNGKPLYTNSKVGLKFVFPQGWHVGNDFLGYGSLQLFNYDETKAPGKGGFPSDEGINKIEAIVTDNSVSDSATPDYPEKSRKTTQANVAGQTATLEDIEFVSQGKIRTYYVPLSNTQGKFLSITIFGDPSNFQVLDEIVQSIEWTK